MTKYSLLLVEDEKRVRELTDGYLTQHGFAVSAVESGEQALKAFLNDSFDLIVLDLNLPNLDGMDVLRSIRLRGMCPVIVVSARQEDRARLQAFELGADDFLVKPYNPRELVARIQALLRRSHLPSIEKEASALSIEKDKEAVYLYGWPVNLSPTEFELLCVLASDPGRVFSREELLYKVWGKMECGSSRRVDLYVSRLRARIHQPNGDDLILSVFKRGYRLKADIEVKVSEVKRPGLLAEAGGW